MADNYQVLNAAGATTTFRSTDNGAAVQIPMSIPTNTSGTALLGAQATSNSIPVVLATGTMLTVVSTAGAPAAVTIKATAGTIWNVNFYNNATTVRFFKLYNATTGAVSSAVAPKFTVGVAPGAQRDCDFPAGLAFTTAISYLITGLIATTDTTAVGIDDLHGIVNFG